MLEQTSSLPEASSLPEITESSALTFLLQNYPLGFHVDAVGNLTDIRKSEKVTNLNTFAEKALATRNLQLEINGEFFEFNLRALSGEETSAIDKLIAEAGEPPKKYKTERGAQVEDGNDFTPEYMEKLMAARKKQRAYALSKALTGMEVPGDSLDDKTKWLEANIPERILQALYAAITKLSVDPIQRASFI